MKLLLSVLLVAAFAATAYCFLEAIRPDPAEVGSEVGGHYHECHCHNNNMTCACCEHLNFSIFHGHFHEKFVSCVEIDLFADDHEAEFKLTFDGRVLKVFNITSHEPKPHCAKLHLPPPANFIKGCLDLKDIYWENGKFDGCAYLEARVLGSTIAKFKMGCWNITYHKGNDVPLMALEDLML